MCSIDDVIVQRLRNQRTVSLDGSIYKCINSDKTFVHEVSSKSVSFTQLFGTDFIDIENLFIVKHNLLPVNTTIILIIIVLVLIHN